MGEFEDYFQLGEGIVLGEPSVRKSTEKYRMLLNDMQRKLQLEALMDLAISSALGLDLTPKEAEEVEMHGFSDHRWFRSMGIKYPKGWE
jgi:hypothetical protein